MKIYSFVQKLLFILRSIIINIFHLLNDLISFIQRPFVNVKWQFRDTEQLHSYRDNQSNNKKIAICTAIFGSYDSLRLPMVIDNDVDYICFTDLTLDTFGVWKLSLSPYYNHDPVRMARFVKTHLHSLLPQYETLIWIDANVTLNTSIHNYIDDFVQNSSDAAFIKHPHRNCLYDELLECIVRRKDSINSLMKQRDYYLRSNFPRQIGLIESNFFIINNHANNVKLFMKLWWSQIEQFSRRDQPSLMYALHECNTHYSFIIEEGKCVRTHEDFIFYPHRESKLLTPPEELDSYSVKQSPEHLDKADLNDEVSSYKADIIICVYNALDKVQMCLDSVVKYRRTEDNIIVIDDKSDNEVSHHVKQYCETHSINYTLNSENMGYVQSANKGLSQGQSDFKILLNSDTIVTKGWVSKLLNAAYSSDDIGIVGPMSNAASYQSIPQISSTKGQTAINPIDKSKADELSIKCEEWAEKYSIPIVPLVHGFCFGIKQSVIEDIGVFDNQTFKKYYGEENDYCFRARYAGYTLAIATNCYIHHFKSESISSRERLLHMPKAGIKLRRKHGAKNVKKACLIMNDHPTLKSIRQSATDYLA